MPHIQFTAPYRTSDGVTHRQGETVYVSSADARGILADQRGKVVYPSPAEVVELAGGKPPKPAPAKTEASAEGKSAPRKSPAAEAKKPEDG